MAKDPTKDSGKRSALRLFAKIFAKADQVIDSDRKISGPFQVFFEHVVGTKTVSLLLDPDTPRVAASAIDSATSELGSFQVTKAGINFVASPKLILALNSDAGLDGETIMSGGAAGSATWGGVATIASASAPTQTNVIWLNTTDGELYTYDSSLSEWLGRERTAEFYRNATITAGLGHFSQVRLNWDSNTDPAQRKGWLVPYDCVITGISGAFQADTTGWTHRISVYDRSANTHSFPWTLAPAGSYSTISATGLSISCDALDEVGVSAITGTAAILWQRYHVTYRKRAS